MRIYAQSGFSVKKRPIASLKSGSSSDTKTVNFLNSLRRIQKNRLS